MIVAFWIIFGITLFAAALSMQMRIMIAITLARCLAADRPKYEYEEARRLVRYVRHEGALEEDLEPIRTLFAEKYSQAWGHLRTARRASVLLMPVVLGLAILYRFVLFGS
ncbi:MAG: hypothetical protein AAFX02_05895 [Pseudomonadota bacterium]